MISTRCLLSQTFPQDNNFMLQLLARVTLMQSVMAR